VVELSTAREAVERTQVVVVVVQATMEYPA
jgi:hypothetical protein